MSRLIYILPLIAGLSAGCGYIPEGDLGMDEGQEGKRYPGDPCDDAGEPWSICIDGYVCSQASGTCELAGDPAAGTVPQDAPCTNNAHCGYGLVCANVGTCQPEGADGTTAVDEVCDATEDCQAFLTCIEGFCKGFQPETIWLGVTCSDLSDDDFKVLFEVDGESEEFYRLPYPNDIRRKNGKIDLSGHPTPGTLSEEIGDPSGAFIDIVENDLDGFGTQSSVFFRFSEYPNAETLEGGVTYFFVNIDPDSEDYGSTSNSGYRVASAGGRYICGNWLAITPSNGKPLEPNTTYAVILTDGIEDRKGNALASDADFLSMIRSSKPDDDALADAWEAYQPLRDYLRDDAKVAEIDRNLPDSIAAAAVFTTGDPTAPVRKMREAVHNADAPVIKDWDTNDNDALFEIHTGTVSVPFYQEGTRPFARPDDGGAISYGSNGLPRLVETEDVKFALTVPTTIAPESGWPVIIYAHGTGGDEQSFIDNGIAARMAVADIEAAVLSMEQVQHGDRRGLSEEEDASGDYTPEYMFYNFLNARAARDNNLQASAELFQAVRLVESFASISGEDIVFDSDRIYFFGHSQGTQGSFLGAAFEPAIKGMILSGAGGVLIESMLGKKKPVDIANAMKLVMMDLDLTRTHPMLNIVQSALDSVDPVNYARSVFLDDLTALDIQARHVFMSSGQDDSYTPEKTQAGLAYAMGLRQYVTSGSELEGVILLDQALPQSGNRGLGERGTVTAVMVRYAPEDGEDGHFVMFDNADAQTQADTFIRTMISPDDESPILVEP